MESHVPDVELIFSNEPARQAFECFKNVEILGDVDATVLDIIRMDGLITGTNEIIKKNVLQKDRDGTGKNVVVHCDSFRAGESDVDCVVRAEIGQRNTATRQKLYWKGGKIPMDIGGLHKIYLPLACKRLI